MERRDDGIFIPKEQIERVKKIAGWIGIGVLALEAVRLVFRRQFLGKQ